MKNNYPGSGKIRKTLGRDNRVYSGSPTTKAIQKEAERLMKRGKTRQVAYNLARKKLNAKPWEPESPKFVRGGSVSPK
jgi:hypothetical protein